MNRTVHDKLKKRIDACLDLIRTSSVFDRAVTTPLFKRNLNEMLDVLRVNVKDDVKGYPKIICYKSKTEKGQDIYNNVEVNNEFHEGYMRRECESREDFITWWKGYK